MNMLGNFKWESGSINDNIRKIFIEKGIRYRNTFGGDIEIDLFGIDFWEKVKHTLINSDNEVYAVYLD